MARYSAYAGPEWVADIVASDESEAWRQALTINPDVDTIEFIKEVA